MFTFLPTKEIILLNMSKILNKFQKIIRSNFSVPRTMPLKLNVNALVSWNIKNIASINPEKVSKVLEDILCKVNFYRGLLKPTIIL